MHKKTNEKWEETSRCHIFRISGPIKSRGASWANIGFFYSIHLHLHFFEYLRWRVQSTLFRIVWRPILQFFGNLFLSLPDTYLVGTMHDFIFYEPLALFLSATDYRFYFSPNVSLSLSLALPFSSSYISLPMAFKLIFISSLWPWSRLTALLRQCIGIAMRFVMVFFPLHDFVYSTCIKYD